MRVGVLCRADQLAWAQGLGFRSVEIMRFLESPLAVPQADWRPLAEELSAQARQLDLRISALGAYYRNALDPKQTEKARATVRRAIEVAAHMGVKTVSGFAGGVIATTINERGGNPVYQPLENYLPQIVAFWQPLAMYAADQGVRLAFEHCPQGAWHLPVMGYNLLGRPALWERFFDAMNVENVGLEWDASHLICQFIDPLENLRRFGSRIFHVHAKDASVNHDLLATYGICHPGVVEHRGVGLGQLNWAEVVHALWRAGYDSDLNVEGFHDPVFRDHDAVGPDDGRNHGASRLSGRKLEEAGLIIARKTLEPYTAGTE